jgi:hypothetical protein
MKMHQVSDHCFAVINEKNRFATPIPDSSTAAAAW